MLRGTEDTQEASAIEVCHTDDHINHMVHSDYDSKENDSFQSSPLWRC